MFSSGPDAGLWQTGGSGRPERVVLVTDIPPCLNYSGGIFLDHILQSIDYDIRDAVVIMDRNIKPVLSARAKADLAITWLSKPFEYHERTKYSAASIRKLENDHRKAVERITVPSVMRQIQAVGATSLWVLLEGQTMIRVAYELVRRTKLPIIVQVMDAPLNWFYAHGIDPETTQELLEQYRFTLRHASACAAASFEMARIYAGEYGIKSFPVLPSLPIEVALPPSSLNRSPRPFKIAVAGQLYARDEWNALLAALDSLDWRIGGRAVQVCAFTHNVLDARLIAEGKLVGHPWVSTEELLHVLQDMDLMYCPYRFGEAYREEATLSYPSKLTTYLAAGKPAFFHGPAYASPAKLLHERRAGFTCHSMDPEQIAWMLVQALSDPDEYERTAMAGRRLFDNSFCYQSLAETVRSTLAYARTHQISNQRFSDRTPGEGRPVILVVAFGESVHTARWMNMVLNSEFRFVLCPSIPRPPSVDFRAVRLVRDSSDLDELQDGELGYFDVDSVEEEELATVEGRIGYQAFRPAWLSASTRLTSPGHVVAAIRRFGPVAVHSMEVQFSGYLVLAAKEYLGDFMPRWLLSNWGSDIFLYRKLAGHRKQLGRIAQLIDGYLAECHRDVQIVRELGFQGTVGPTMPASGGVDFADFPALDQFEPPSRRREIHVKGYHGWSGRGMHILSALHLAAPALSGFTIRVMLASAEMKEVVDTMRNRDGLDIVCDSYVSSYREAILRLGRARISIGLGISDGISTTLLEAMAVGSFPIKGSGSCADEWIGGRGGIVVSPHDVRAMADALIRAATDDALVDGAMALNRKTVEERWNSARNGAAFLDFLRTFCATVQA